MNAKAQTVVICAAVAVAILAGIGAILVVQTKWGMVGTGSTMSSTNVQPTPAPVPSPVTASASRTVVLKSSTVTIDGGAWLNRADGHSDVLRGLRILLVRKTVPSPTVAESLQPELTRLNVAIQVEKNNRHRFVNGSEIIDNYPSEAEKTFSAARDRLGETILKLKSSTTPVDLREVKAITENVTRDGVPVSQWIRLAEVVGTAETDIDGKFKFRSIDDGNYYLCSRTEPANYTVEWLVPVTISGSNVELNLHNENAVLTKNPPDRKL